MKKKIIDFTVKAYSNPWSAAGMVIAAGIAGLFGTVAIAPYTLLYILGFSIYCNNSEYYAQYRKAEKVIDTIGDRRALKENK